MGQSNQILGIDGLHCTPQRQIGLLMPDRTGSRPEGRKSTVGQAQMLQCGRNEAIVGINATADGQAVGFQCRNIKTRKLRNTPLLGTMPADKSKVLQKTCKSDERLQAFSGTQNARFEGFGTITCATGFKRKKIILIVYIILSVLFMSIAIWLAARSPSALLLGVR